MIYVVSNNEKINSIDIVTPINIQSAIDMIKSWPVVQFDTETTGLDSRICSLISMQFGYKNYADNSHTAIVVDCKTISPEHFKDVLEKSYIIGHNLKFDLQFLYNHNITPLNVYDTFICEQVLYLGYKPGQVSMNLSSVLYRHTGKTIDKTMQKQIYYVGLTKKGIEYSANDVMDLQDIRKSQIAIAKERKCINAFTVENEAVPAIAYLEWCGIKLDEQRWEEKMKKDNDKLNDSLNKLNQYVSSHPKLSKFTQNVQLDIFADSEEQSTCDINWDSPQQVTEVFNKLGFNTKTIDKETSKEKNTILEKFIITQKGINDEFLKLYYDYKGYSKVVSSYGQNLLNLINPRTNRIHTIFTQLGTVTGRMSSGSNKNNNDLSRIKNIKKCKYINLQNLPSRGEDGKTTRACFVSNEGNVFISCDYSAQESRISADVWNEKSLIKAFEEGIDTHNLYAKLCFPDELKNVDIKDVKKLRPDLREKAKVAEFAVNYGSNGASIAAAIGVSKEKAISMVQNILSGMIGMADYKKRAIKELKDKGYITLHPLTGHRVYWPQWSQWISEEARFDRTFWEEYRTLHKGTGDSVAQMVKKHMEISGDWFNKNVLNYPIQGGAAIVLKYAVARLFRWIIDNNLFNSVLFCAFVHDEICCECPAHLQDKVASVVKTIMEKSSARFYKKLLIPAEPSIGTHWIH